MRNFARWKAQSSASLSEKRPFHSSIGMKVGSAWQATSVSWSIRRQTSTDQRIAVRLAHVALRIEVDLDRIVFGISEVIDRTLPWFRVNSFDAPSAHAKALSRRKSSIGLNLE